MNPEHLKTEKAESQEDVVLRVFLQRHGPKLSAAGEKDEVALYFGESVNQGFEKMGIEHGEGLVHVSSSPVERAMRTAAIEQERIAASKHRHGEEVGILEQLATPYQPAGAAASEMGTHDFEKLIKLQAEFEPSIREQVAHEYPGSKPDEIEEMVRDRIDMKVLGILFEPKDAEKHGLMASYEVMADNLAARYEGFLKHVGFLANRKDEGGPQPPAEPYLQVDVSHSYPIMSLLKKYLVFEDGSVAKQMAPGEFFEKLGGVISESDSLTLDYVRSASGNDLKVRGSFAPDKEFKGSLIFDR